MITGKAIEKPIEVTFRIAEWDEKIGEVKADAGDFILTDAGGKQSIVKPSVFMQKYKVLKISKSGK